VVEVEDLYAILNVTPGSDSVVIRAAYKALMLKYHPDTNPSKDATDKAAIINRAFSILSDPTKRAAYDASRSRQSTRRASGQRGEHKAPPSQSSSTKAPPAPPPRPSTSAPPPRSEESKPRFPKEWIGLGVIIAVFVGLGVLSSQASPPTQTGANYADMNMSNDVMVDDSVSALPLDNAVSSDIESNILGNIIGDSSEIRFRAYSPSAVDYGEIEQAATTFDRVLRREGIIGARSFSENCHRRAAAEPSWAALDRCAAFDFAASYVDSGFAEVTGARKNSYFSFQRQNQAAHYSELGAASYASSQRLNTIRVAAEQAVLETVEARLARDEPRPSEESDLPLASDNSL